MSDVKQTDKPPRKADALLEQRTQDLLYTMGMYRMRVEMMAQMLGMSKSTLERALKKKRYSAAREALLRGQAVATFDVTKTAYTMAKSGKHPLMTRFWLKTQERWRETDRLELTGANGGPVKTTDLTPKERKEKLSKLLNALAHTEEFEEDSEQ